LQQTHTRVPRSGAEDARADPRHALQRERRRKPDVLHVERFTARLSEIGKVEVISKDEIALALLQYLDHALDRRVRVQIVVRSPGEKVAPCCGEAPVEPAVKLEILLIAPVLDAR